MTGTKTQAKPFFSLIIPTLNEEKYLPHLLSDLGSQTFTDFEILVIDGKSTDKTVEVARKFPKTTVVISQMRNVGYQRNLGAKKAKGGWIIFFDADTRIPHFFLEGVKYHLTVTNPDVFTTWMKTDSCKSGDKAIITIFNFALESSKNTPSPNAWGAMLGCRKKSFITSGGFNTKITFGEDSELVRRMIKLGFIYILFRDPQFIYSLRRFRKEGTLNLFQKYALLDINLLFNKFPQKSSKLYPMDGGSYYDKKHTSPMLSWLVDFSKEMKHLKPEKLTEIIKKLFTE